MTVEVTLGTGMLIGWMCVDYVPGDEGDGSDSEDMFDDVQRSCSRQRRQTIVLTLRPAVFDRHILSLDIAGLDPVSLLGSAANAGYVETTATNATTLKLYFFITNRLHA